jgi:hypothetical protein
VAKYQDSILINRCGDCRYCIEDIEDITRCLMQGKPGDSKRVNLSTVDEACPLADYEVIDEIGDGLLCELHDYLKEAGEIDKIIAVKKKGVQ